MRPAFIYAFFKIKKLSAAVYIMTAADRIFTAPETKDIILSALFKPDIFPLIFKSFLLFIFSLRRYEYRMGDTGYAFLLHGSKRRHKRSGSRKKDSFKISRPHFFEYF